ncbi:RNA polymerase I enhancer binding protein [Aspergillus viridinutans]|uniref:RNA polymerase I enhancer binding protein n=1 Tax=Aspergillus viridinutans TaxID=75553 RepID=A0A9P3BSS4_ASPVI|nr:RNA polymerase I enhancer binding protein [Aspergillus viridinutans]GIJ99325.1 RNA polymerase I enhancer binding protein [Aspergillus viridinutans]
MGQGSSQPMNGGLSEPENQVLFTKDRIPTSQNIAALYFEPDYLQDMSEDRDAVGPSSPPKTSKKVKSETQVEGTVTPKRKRKQTANDTNIGMPSDTPDQSHESPLDQAGAPPVKRTKIAPSTSNTKEARKPEKNGNREAIPAPESPVIANVSETREAQRQSTDMQPLTDVAHTNGTASKKPKKSKAKVTQQDEGKEVSALPQSPAETKTIRMASANPSLADSSTDQKDLTDTSAARGPRKGKTDKMIGFFAPSEVSALETFKLQFCNEHAISSERFDRMVQHVDRRKDSGWPCDESIIKKPDFWQQVYDVLPSRDRRSVYRFMRRHFQDSSQKPHHWTHEQDDELIDLVGRYGPRFAHIAKILGRVEDDVVQRWKNRLEHRSTMRRGAWSEEEVRGLLDALQASWNNLKKDGQDVGRDIYEMDESLISWGTVSNKLQNCRSRQQCADKWRKIRRKIMGQRGTGNQNAVYDPATEAKPQGRAKSITLAEQMEMERMLKSSEYVDSEDEDEEDMEQSAGIESQSPEIKDEGESADKKPTIMAAPEKLPATSAKALNKGSQINASQTEIDDDSESEASSDSAESASEDASEGEMKSGSGAGSASDSESSVESDEKPDARMSAKSPKGQEKDVTNNKASSAKSSSKPTKPTPNQKVAERSKPKTSDGRQPRSQATKTSASDSSVKAKTNAIPRAKASKPSKSITKEEEMPQATSSESESDSESASDSSDSEGETTSSSEEPSDRQSTKVAPKAPTSNQKASVKGQVSQKTQNKDESEESSSTSDETSSGDDSTDDSETDDDNDSDSDSSAVDNMPVKSLKTAARGGTKRKAWEPAEQTGKSESKRLKTGQMKSSSSSSSARSTSEDSESEDDSATRSGIHDSDSGADTDESSSASDSANSTSKPQPNAKSKSKQPTAQPKVPKAINAQKPELSKSRTPAVSKEGSNAKNGQSGPKQKPRQVNPSFPQAKKDGEKAKGKPGSTPVSKGKKSK